MPETKSGHAEVDVAVCRDCDYLDHSPGPCTCPEHPVSALHPFGGHHGRSSMRLGHTGRVGCRCRWGTEVEGESGDECWRKIARAYSDHLAEAAPTLCPACSGSTRAPSRGYPTSVGMHSETVSPCRCCKGSGQRDDAEVDAWIDDGED